MMPYRVEYFDTIKNRVRVRVVYAYEHEHAKFIFGVTFPIRSCELDVEQCEIDLELFLAYRAIFPNNMKPPKGRTPNYPFMWVINDTPAMIAKIGQEAQVNYEVGPHMCGGDRGSKGMFVHVDDLLKLQHWFRDSHQFAEADWTGNTIRLANAINRHREKVKRDDNEEKQSD